jgi:hypothetical protein
LRLCQPDGERRAQLSTGPPGVPGSRVGDRLIDTAGVASDGAVDEAGGLVNQLVDASGVVLLADYAANRNEQAQSESMVARSRMRSERTTTSDPITGDITR